MTGPEARRDTDLERIEDALAKGRVGADDPRERELQELALALRADSPEPEPRFAAELDRRVAAGFKKPRSRMALPRAWKPMLAGAVALLLVVVAVTSIVGSDRSSTSISAGLATEATPPSARTAPLTPSGVASSAAPADTGRHVERSAQITLSTPADKLQSAADGVGTVAQSHGGFVLSSNVSTGDQGAPGGSFTLRVPAREIQGTLADLSKLGHMEARTESAQDMTAPYRSTQNRLGSLLIERRALRLRLRRAHGAKADSIRVRISRVSAEIDSLSGRMDALRRRTVYSTVNVTLQEQRGGSGAGGTGTGAAFHDALHTLQALLNFCVRALAVLLPLLVAAAIAAFGARAFRRRRREAALL
jgi:hypothetical protein